jgi:OmpA-like transmembrane domain
MHLARVLLAASLACVGPAAPAAESGFYFGLMGGRAEYEFEAPRFILPVAVASPSPLIRPVPPALSGPPAFFMDAAIISPVQWPPDADDASNAYGLTVGYRILRYAAVELSYLELGSLERTDVVAGGILPPLRQFTFEHELETSGPAVSALGILPLGESFELYARAGVLFADMDLTTRLTSTSTPVIAMGDSSITFGSDSLLWGAGAQFNWGKHWTVRVDFQLFDSVGEDSGPGEADIDLLTLGVLYRL